MLHTQQQFFRQRGRAVVDFPGSGHRRRPGFGSLQKLPAICHLGICEKLAYRFQFNDTPTLHDGDTVAILRDNAEIVRYDDGAETQFAAPAHQQVQHLNLNGGIQTECCIVGQHHIRLRYQRHGDHDTLRHAAGQFMRVGMYAPLRLDDANLIE